MIVANVDLTKETVKITDVDLEGYIGGKGAATKLLFNIPPKVDPLHPDNAIIFAIGPLNGIRLSGASRMTCVFKSPLTFGYGESQCGGFAAYEMRKSGIDLIYITGKAKKPVYLVVEDKSVEIKDATHLWGRDCYETEDILRKDEGGEVLSIGQAGENLVRFACISHRKGRQFGRCGAGAVMGSKNLKAIVIKGSGEVSVADEDGLEKSREWLKENILPNLEGMKKYGTPAIMSLTNEAGVFPTKYWQFGSFSGFEKINAEALQKYVKRKTACYACAVACGKIVEIDGIKVEGPEYETLFSFGALCDNDDLKIIAKANDLCDKYGMDTISAGNVVAFYMAHIANFDPELIPELVEKIAFRRDIGNVLAEGVKRAAELLNSKVEPVHVRGLEPPGYDPRGLYSMALAYVTSQRGACHMRSCAYRPNLAGAVNRFSPENQAKLVKDLEDFYCVVDSLVFCRFLCLPMIGMYWDDIARLYRIVTGKDLSVDKLKEIGERIWTLTREFNLREGVKAKLPETFFKAIKHYDMELVVRKEDYEMMVDEYVKLRGIDGQEIER